MLVAFAVVAIAYAALAMKPPPDALRRGASWCGIGAGVMWAVEIVAGNLLPASLAWLGPVGELGAVALTASAGAWGARRFGDARAGLRCGLWSGLVSGTIAAMTIMTTSELFAGSLGDRPEYAREFARSGEPDMTTFLVKDAVFAGTSHLYIGVVLGLLAGGLAGVAAASRG